MDWAGIAALITAALTGSLSIYLAWRKSARQERADALREYSELVDRLQEDVRKTAEEAASVRAEHAKCIQETAALRERVRYLEESLADLRARLTGVGCPSLKAGGVCPLLKPT